MGRIKYHRATGVAHDQKCAHIGHQVVVTKRCATLAHHDLFVTHRAGFFHHVGHIPGRKKLRLFDIDRLALACDVLNKVGLPTKKGRCLQNVDHGRHFIQRRVLVHVGQDRHPKLTFHPLQYTQAGLDTGAAVTFMGSAVGLVERSLEDKRNTQLGGDGLERRCNLKHQRFGLNDTGPGNQKERCAPTDLIVTQAHR